MPKEDPQQRPVVAQVQELLQEAQSELFAFVEALPADPANRDQLRSGAEDLQLVLDRTRAAFRNLNGKLEVSGSQASSPAQQKLYASFRAFLRAELQLAAALLSLSPESAAKSNMREAMIPIEVAIGSAFEAYLALAAATRPAAKPEIGQLKPKR